jgi:hypothetical protein
MTDRPGPDWAHIRHLYEDTDAPVADICAAGGIDRRDLDSHRKREGWRRQHPRPFPPRKPAVPSVRAGLGPGGHGPPPATPQPQPQPPAVDPDANTAPSTPDTTRRRLLDRLVAAISLKLEQLERRMTTDLALLAAGEPATAVDHERETRAIGALIDNLGKITEIEADLSRPADAKRGPSPADTDLADEADRWRSELASRLSRIIEAAGRSA